MICHVIGAGRDFGVEVEYSFDGEKLLGTAGAVKNALHLLGDSFFVLYGDSYLVCDYASVEGKFWASGKSTLMTVYRNDGKWDTSNVEFENGRILAYSKKNRTPRMRYIDYGLGVFSSKALAGISSGAPYDLAELYGKMLERGQLAGMEIHQRFYEIGSPSGLEETARFLTKEKVSHK
jgi:MurNAc alpha-1-phosphate uridylyltransferase